MRANLHYTTDRQEYTSFHFTFTNSPPEAHPSRRVDALMLSLHR